MYSLFIPAFLTGLILLFDVREQRRKPTYKYVALFLLMAGINFLFSFL